VLINCDYLLLRESFYIISMNLTCILELAKWLFTFGCNNYLYGFVYVIHFIFHDCWFKTINKNGLNSLWCVCTHSLIQRVIVSSIAQRVSYLNEWNAISFFDENLFGDVYNTCTHAYARTRVCVGGFNEASHEEL